MSNPVISQITLPNGTTYDLKDEVARAQQVGSIIIRGETTTALTDNATTNPIQIGGESYTAVANDAVFCNHKEFVFDGTKWHEFGDMSGLGALALKDNAKASYTPAGSVSTPSFTGTELTSKGAYTPGGSVSVNAASGSGAAYTPEGTVGAPEISVSASGSTASIKPFGSAGSLPTLTMTVANENLSISFNQGTLPSAGTAVTVKTGDASYQASAPTFSGTTKKFAFSGTASTVTVKGTPAGSVSQPTFSGTATTITVS